MELKRVDKKRELRFPVTLCFFLGAEDWNRLTCNDYEYLAYKTAKLYANVYATKAVENKVFYGFVLGIVYSLTAKFHGTHHCGWSSS